LNNLLPFNTCILAIVLGVYIYTILAGGGFMLVLPLFKISAFTYLYVVDHYSPTNPPLPASGVGCPLPFLFFDCLAWTVDIIFGGETVLLILNFYISLFLG